MSSYTASMFASIKDSLNKPQETNFKDILKFEAGKTYAVRLIPNIKSAANTFFHYYHYSWKSFATGQFVSFVSPQTIGERCPIAEESYKIYKSGSVEEKEKGKAIFRKENFLVNVYVISDPTNPDNDGKVKIMRYGKQLQKIILSAIEGDDAAEFGEKIFDLSPAGCNLRIKCEKKTEKGKAEFVEYSASRFLNPSVIEGLDEQKIDEIYNNIHDLTAVFPIKSTEELKAGLQEHYYGVVSGSESEPKKTKSNKPASTKVSTDDAPDDDDIPMEYKQKPAAEVTKPSEPVKTEQAPAKPAAEAPKKPTIEDDAIKNLLNGLDSL